MHCILTHLAAPQSTNPIVNNAMGLTNDLTGGSSLMWRYHHQVSHHM